MSTREYRYGLPKKSIKADCPQCGPKHRKTLSRYVDNQTGDPLPDEYGRCDRESNCGYHLSPYHKGPFGKSYADENARPTLPKEWFRIAGNGKRNRVSREGAIKTLVEMCGESYEQAKYVVDRVYDRPASRRPVVVYGLPNELVTQSQGHYQQNQFARLLIARFGEEKADELLKRFLIGTSGRWPGATVFWYIDELGRVRGGQIKLFGPDWHTVKYKDRDGKEKSKTSWVHASLTYQYKQKREPLPQWLADYNQKGECSPCLFGLPQLTAAGPVDKPIAIVEAPKTAVIATAYMPDFIWLATGSKSYLTPQRLAPLRGRKIMLYPDLNAYAEWSKTADELRRAGFQVKVSDVLERGAIHEQRKAGLDLADFLLQTSAVENTRKPQPGPAGVATPGAPAAVENPIKPKIEPAPPLPPGPRPGEPARAFLGISGRFYVDCPEGWATNPRYTVWQSVDAYNSRSGLIEFVAAADALTDFAHPINICPESLTATAPRPRVPK